MSEQLKREILAKVREYYRQVHARREFIPGKTKVNYAGRVFGEEEMANLVDASLDFMLTAGPWARQLEEGFTDLFRSQGFVLVNSGSSANLLMVSALRSAQFEDRLQPGDEVITPSVTFPTTLTPILQNQLVPVFVDCEVGTYNVDPGLLEGAVGPRTRALFLPHTLGNPCAMDQVMELARRKALLVIEDTCDALGATYRGKPAGSFGAMSSLSFYPAHQMTMGEGGGVSVNDPRLLHIVRSLRDWGRDCWCEGGKNDSCGKRFTGQHGKLPFGYDHKYVYSNIGYNLKATDLQAAIGVAQLARVPSFVAKRRENFAFYMEAFRELGDRLVLPRWEEGAEPSWFGFPLTAREGVEVKRLIAHLERANIETRKVFAGNILKQPGFLDIPHRIHGTLERTDLIMERTFFIGVYPGLTEEMRDYVARTLKGYFDGNSR